MHAGLLDFFVLEASECTERLDALLARAGAGAPDLEAFTRQARALRGSATMAKVAGVADVAMALERVAKGLHDRSLEWSASLKGAVVAAVDDLKILIRGVRTWGSAEERRAADRAQELASFAPAHHRRSVPTPIAGGGTAGFLAAETADVAAGLLRFADNPSSAFDATIRRVRALRGVAALLDLPPLAEVVAAVDDAAKPLELGTAKATEPQRALFRAAAAVLREGSDAVHAGGRPDPASSAVLAFTSAVAALGDGAGDADYIVPVSALFPDDGESHVLHTAANPPTTPPQRFRLEAVSQAEHMRRLVSDARRALDAPSRQRLGRELRSAVLTMARVAESFGELAVARALHAFVAGAATLEERVLDALEKAAAILTAPGDARLSSGFEALAGTAPTPIRSSTPIRATAAVRAMAPAPLPDPATPMAADVNLPALPAAEAPPAPSGAALHDLLGAGIAGLSRLADEPLSEPAPVDDDFLVPIEDLLYRGNAALRRAIELGDRLKKAATPEAAEALTELHDLLELATTE